jgi:phage terminase large subunit-like protein
VREYGGDVLVERNHYGDLAAANVRAAFRDARSKDASVREPRIIEVQASESKGARAAPISAATTRGQVHHVGRFPRLELEMTTWVPGKGRSPNGVDALCHGATELLGLDDEHPRIDARREVLAAAAATRAFRAAPRSL